MVATSRTLPTAIDTNGCRSEIDMPMRNAQRVSWSAEKVNALLKDIMSDIHALCLARGDRPAGTPAGYVTGAYIAQSPNASRRLAKTMQAYGVV